MQTTRYFFLMVIMMQHWVLLWFPVMRYVISRPVWGTHQAPSVNWALLYERDHEAREGPRKLFRAVVVYGWVDWGGLFAVG